MSIRKPARLLPSFLLAGISLFAFPAYAVTFLPFVNVSNSGGEAANAGIAVNGSYVHTAWSEDSSVYYSRSTDSGSTFGAATRLFSVSGVATGYGSPPLIATSGSNVYVARSQRPKPNKPSQVYFRRSTNDGASFGSQVQISNGGGNAVIEGMAVSGSKVYIAWTDFAAGNWDVFLARSIDGGATFQTPSNVTWTGPGLIASDLFYAHSNTEGAAYSLPINMSHGATNSFGVVASNGANVYVSWSDGSEIYLAHSRTTETQTPLTPPSTSP